MRSCVPVLLLGALMFALMGAWIFAGITQPLLTKRVAAGISPRPDAPSDPSPCSSEAGIEDDEDGDGDGVAHVADDALSLSPPLAPVVWVASPAWRYVGFVSEPSTPPPRA